MDDANLIVRIDRLENAIQRVLKTMEGNGKLGLVDRVAKLEAVMTAVNESNIVKRLGDLETSVNNHQVNESARLHADAEAEKERKDFWRKVALATITMVITNVGAIITAAILIVLRLK